MEPKSWGTSFVEATQVIALLNLFVKLTVVHSGLLAVTVSSNQRFEHQQGDRRQHQLS